MIELNKIYNEDCLEGMKRIPDGSVDLVLTDPPYNIGKAKWDKIPDYINWCGKWIKECARVLKDNGSFYFWHNDMAQIAQLMEWIRQNTKFVYNSFCIWDKGDFRALAWKNPSQENNLRSWFNTCEYCLYYNKASGVQTEWDRTGLEQILPLCFEPYLDYMTSEKNVARMSVKEINEVAGYASIASHWFWQEQERRQPQPRFIQEADYKKLQSTGRWAKPYEDLRREYEDLRREYEDLRREYEDSRREYEDLRYVHNLDASHNNVWKSSEHNSGKQHPTQKPIDLMERIVKTSSKEGGIILDPFMGSGTTAIACINTGRNYVGFEMDKQYCDIANERIQKALAEKELGSTSSK